MITRENVEGVYKQAASKANQYRKIGLWLADHRDEFKDVKEDLGQKVAEASGFDRSKITEVAVLCRIYDAEKNQKEEEISL